jgi:hypothetical protein
VTASLLPLVLCLELEALWFKATAEGRHAEQQGALAEAEESQGGM